MDDRGSVISVVIPTYNRRELLPRAIGSVLNQTRAPREIIVVDDGSTDDTAQIVGNDFPQVELILQENQGVSAARNSGIKTAPGDWLAFLDSDDAWLPHKLEKQLDMLVRHPEMKICHTGETWLKNDRQVGQKKKHQKPSGWIFQKCLELCAISPSSVLIKREVFDTVGLFDESLPACEDYDLWVRISARYEVHCVEEPLTVKYGGHPGQLSCQWGLDRYRIHALCKILDSGRINRDDVRAVHQVLSQKCHIYALGALKRGKKNEHDHFIKLPENYIPMS